MWIKRLNLAVVVERLALFSGSLNSETGFANDIENEPRVREHRNVAARGLDDVAPMLLRHKALQVEHVLLLLLVF